jgi:hypothetical protein
MRVSTTALYTLAALIAGDLTQQALAHPVSSAPERSEAEDIESAEFVLPSLVEAVTPPEQLQAIAFAEAVLTQYSEEYSRELTEALDSESVSSGIDLVDSDPSVLLADTAGVELFPASTETIDGDYDAAYWYDAAEEFDAVHLEASALEASVKASEIASELSNLTDIAFALAIDEVTSSSYHELTIAPPEAIALPERMPQVSEEQVSEEQFSKPVPQGIEAIATPEFFMPERTEPSWSFMADSVNVLPPIAQISESAQPYALNDLEDAEDLWIRAVIEAEFA